MESRARPSEAWTLCGFTRVVTVGVSRSPVFPRVEARRAIEIATHVCDTVRKALGAENVILLALELDHARDSFYKPGKQPECSDERNSLGLSDLVSLPLAVC